MQPPTPTQPAPRPQPAPSPGTHERGYTLQTLIVTAIAALLAVMAVVLVVAVTTAASDDLAGTPPDIQTHCQPWEIHDLELAAAGAGGGKKIHPVAYRGAPTTGEVPGSSGVNGVTSSAIGCLAPCYLTLDERVDYTVDLAIKNGNDHVDDPLYQAVSFDSGDRIGGASWDDDYLKYDTSNRLPDYSAALDSVSGGPFEVRLGVVHAIDALVESRFYRTDTVTDITDGFGDLGNEGIINSTTTGVRWVIVASLADFQDNFAANPGVRPVGWQEPPVIRGSNVAVRAVAEARACDVYDTVTGEVLASSAMSRVGRVLY